jgi:tetratricopeptide (TPR) repeat protein
MALGNCLMELHSEKEALVCYLNAVQLRPDIKSTWQALIKAMYSSQYLDEALSQLIIAEEHCGYKVEFVYYRAAVLLAKGKTKDAVLFLEQALSENPKKVTALKYIDPELLHHPAFADVLIQYKKGK